VSATYSELRFAAASRVPLPRTEKSMRRNTKFSRGVLDLEEFRLLPCARGVVAFTGPSYEVGRENRAHGDPKRMGGRA
jgi:hypothetical protein